MSAVPVFGHAVQAPMVKAPNAVPRVSANKVEPSPIDGGDGECQHEVR